MVGTESAELKANLRAALGYRCDIATGHRCTDLRL